MLNITDLHCEIDNKAILFDESDDRFALAATNTDDGTTAGNVTINGYEDLDLQVDGNGDVLEHL